ncbi:hypothetical protein [Mesorhizobium sp. SP-1A]|uniref:hypothetical protein n=1 Tax=Mesorhizobium sp. SP-1A TaxID=3077840 RepID=UPI0028F72314|nr:hypothetical protein [Mesorhizobium sp. SP-1A]
MKVTKDNILDMMESRYDRRIGQNRLYIGELEIGQLVRRGKRTGITKTKVVTEYMFRRNSSIGVETELFAGSQSALEKQIATAVVRHIKAGKMEMPSPREIIAIPPEEDSVDEPSGPKM